MDLRCEFIKHGELVEPGIVEFKCRSNKCGHGPGIIVIHRFDTITGDLLETKKYRDPEGVKDGSSQHRAAVRNAAGKADQIHR